MPESDFVVAQIEAGGTSGAQKTRNQVLAAAIEIGLMALFMFGLVIEQLWFFIAFLAAVVALGVLYGRRPRLRARIVQAFDDSRVTSAALLLVLLAAYPIIFSNNPYLVHIGALAAIYVIMALGLNITLGYAGLLDIGFAVYFGAGAYASAQFAIHFDVGFWVGLLIGGVCASLFGFIVAWPALRVQDHYLGLVTLGYGLMMNLLARNLRFLTNGTDGVINIPPPAIGSHSFTQPLVIGSLSLPFQANYYYLAVTFALLTVFVSARLRRSKLGRAWDAIREDEIAARCSGVNARGVKILAFSTGAFFGGIGGAIYAHMIGYISPENFTFLESITILVMVVIGGTGNIFGVATGAILFVVLPERLREFEHLRLLLFGAALVLLMIYRPAGLFPRQRIRRLLPIGMLSGLLGKMKDRLAGGRGLEQQQETQR
jgi:ABC-type branched-subunit amino acid transport system permease subunit